MSAECPGVCSTPRRLHPGTGSGGAEALVDGCKKMNTDRSCCYRKCTLKLMPVSGIYTSFMSPALVPLSLSSMVGECIDRGLKFFFSFKYKLNPAN